ncbi:pyruvate dehydrogenase (acetyl-transferring) E1 component subunit alpha [Propioniciclava flava]|uniref:Pyruvate dehydrogenase (Acetyl-transferring) E1 component subunit alpha n=1 Tax=Propioniciclava flava TaxID=2072026 RepID=A0A4Q2EGF5_9ACTN|nr:pyruvate dehydrogenase (acetyl-transferring) E1 component subunit alpha [Propioniciclava flava]
MQGSYLRLRNCTIGGVIEPLDPDATESVVTPGGTRIVRSEEFIQLLTPEGERVDADGFSYDHDDATLAANLRHMVLGRRFDTEATALQRKGQLGLWPPSLGQEAAQVGSGAAVAALDRVFPSYREHAVALMRGVDPLDMLKTMRGTAMVDWDSVDTRFHLYSFVIGTQALHAVGYAMGMQRDGVVGNPDQADNGAVLVYFGDGATSQGDVSESLVFAASYQAPVVFFVQNNQWAISEPITRQSRIPLYRRATGFGIPSVRVDGNDVLAVQAVTEWALDRARRGHGPTFIEAFTYRMGAHTTSDDPTKYRERAEEEQWRAKDPITRLRTYLLSTGAIDQAWLDALEAESEALGVRIREGCPNLPDPVLEDYWGRVYAQTPPALAAQREAYLAYEASFEGGQA